MQEPKSTMRRVHWRLPVVVAAWASVACLLLLVRVSALVVLALWCLMIGGGGYLVRHQLWVYGLLYRWRSAAGHGGLSVAGTAGKLVAPRVGRVWASADVVRVEFTPHEGHAVKTADIDRLAVSLGLVSGRMESMSTDGLRRSRAYVELRRTRQLSMKEVQSVVVSVWGLPEISVAELPRVGSPSDDLPGEACPDCKGAWDGRRSEVEESPDNRLMPGYEYLPHDCRPHYVYYAHLDAWQAVSLKSAVPNPSCDRWNYRDEGQQPLPEQLAQWSVRPPEPLPMKANMATTRGTHHWCIEFFRQRARALAQGRPPSNVLVQHVGPVGTWREALNEVTVGHGVGDVPWRLRLIDNHVLIAGLTGSGKGSVIWSTIVGLAPAIAAGAVRVWGIDPKRVELNMGRGIFDQYADEADAMLALLERAVELMTMRAELLQQARKRRFEPGPEHPLYVIVIDELGHLSSMYEERKHADRYERALTSLLNLGRSMGFVLIGGLQDPRKKVVDSRDLWPTKVALRMPRPMVDLVLGSQAYANGALCDQIPEQAQGTAFVVDPSNLSEPREVRAGWVSDEAILMVEQALAIWRTQPEEASRRVVTAVASQAAPVSPSRPVQVIPSGGHVSGAIGEGRA